MRPDSSRITTKQLPDGTIEIVADVSKLGGPNYTGPADARAGLVVYADRTLGVVEHGVKVYANALHFAAKRRPTPRKRRPGVPAQYPFIGVVTPVALQWSEVQAGEQRDGESAYEARRRAKREQVKHEHIVDQACRRLWNGVWRRTLDYLDQDALRLARSTQAADVRTLYNLYVRHPALKQVVEQCRVIGVWVEHAATATQERLARQLDPARSVEENLRLARATTPAYADVPLSPGFVAWASRARFHPRVVSLSPHRRLELIDRAATQLSETTSEQLARIQTPDHWFLLNFLLSEGLQAEVDAMLGAPDEAVRAFKSVDVEPPRSKKRASQYGAVIAMLEYPGSRAYERLFAEWATQPVAQFASLLRVLKGLSGTPAFTDPFLLPF